MGTGTDRDDSIDRLLQQQMRHRSVTPAGPCPDAEQMAAWTEGSLPAAEAAAVEQHAADCPRCQALLAAFAVTEPTPARSQVLAFRPMRWAVPIAAGALAAGLLFWIVAPRNRQTSTPTTTVARVEPPAPPGPAPVPQPPVSNTQVSPTSPPRAVTKPKTVAAKAPSISAALPAEAPAPVSGPPPPAASPVPPPPAPAPIAAPPSQTVTIGAAAAREQGRSGAPRTTPNVDVVGEVTPVQTTSSALQKNLSGDLLTSVQVPAARPVIRPAILAGFSSPRTATPAPGVQWRIFSDGHVEYSSDGVTWRRAAVDVLIRVTNGDAPSSMVCWLVGQAGAVLLSTDGGEHFARVDLPTPINLTAVRAVDEHEATVTATNGRTFVTSDGGRSWQ